MDPARLEESLTDRIRRGTRPKAVIVVHLYGQPADMDATVEIRARHAVPLIEDAAESLGATHKGRTRNPSAASAAWCSAAPRRRSPGCALATQAREPAPHYEHTRIGHNYRMSNIAAAIGRGQLTAIEQRLARRRAIFYHYVKRLGSPRASPSCPSPRMLTRVEDRERAALRVALAEVGLAKAAMGVRPSHLDTAARGAPHYVHSCTPVHTDPALKGADTHQSQQATVSGPASCPH